MNTKKELIGASTGLLILSVLAKGPSYGYEIIRSINQQGEGLFLWQEGTIYPVLHKLEQEGLVRAQWQQADTGRERKYYYITAQGRGALGVATEQWRGFSQLVLSLAGDAS